MPQCSAGIDWSDDKHDVLVLTEAGQRVGERQVKHPVEGLCELNEFLQTLTGPEHKTQMACLIETNHGLLIASRLPAGCAVFPVNPNTIEHRRTASGAKTDRIDAYLLAKTGRADFADLRQLQPDSPSIAER